MVTCSNGKAVLVTRHIVIKPRRVAADHHHHHNHYHAQHIVKKERVHNDQGFDGKRFINRRAELLQYSRILRESARPRISPTFPSPKTNFSGNKSPKTQAVNARRRHETPSCFGNCKTQIPNFFKISSPRANKERSKKQSASIGNKMRSITKSLQGGFFSKLFLTSRKAS